MDQPQVGKLIRDLRLLTGLTQEQFAVELGATHSSVSRWERGINKPSPLAMQKVEGIVQQMGDRGRELLQKYQAG
ncbi:MAG: helix-turn-helix domain-containing protein, partial [Xenococcaceae cyanobacterium]